MTTQPTPSRKPLDLLERALADAERDVAAAKRVLAALREDEASFPLPSGLGGEGTTRGKGSVSRPTERAALRPARGIRTRLTLAALKQADLAARSARGALKALEGATDAS